MPGRAGFGLQVEDDPADSADDVVQIGGVLSDPLGDVVIGGPALSAVQRQADGEKLLDDVVMQVLGDPVPVGEDFQFSSGGLVRGAFQVFPRRKRIKELEGLIVDNPSVGNYEELGDLCLDDEQFARARECFDRVIARSDEIDPRYRRALCELALDDFTAAATDLQQVVARDPKYDYQRAAGLHAHALARLGRHDEADALFRDVLATSTLSETQYNYACFLAATGRAAEAREWTERILRKKATMPDYIRRRERPWFRKTAALLKRIR